MSAEKEEPEAKKAKTEESPSMASVQSLRAKLGGGGAVVCILGSTAISGKDTKALLQGIAPKLLAALGSSASVVTGGMPGVQEEFAKHFGGDKSRLFHLLPEGQSSNFGVGKDIHAGKNMEERKAVFGALGDVYITLEGGPGVAQEAAAAVKRGAAVIPLSRTGGASAGSMGFPPAALERPVEAATEAQWLALTSAEAPVAEAVAAVVDIAKKLAEEAAAKAPQEEGEGAKEEAGEAVVKEAEADAPADARPRLTPPAELSDYDCTLDVFLTSGGAFGCAVANTLSHGGFQHLLSGARATAGAKSGRYLFEVRVLEKQAVDGSDAVVRVGFSAAGSSLLMGDGSADAVCFDQDGSFLAPTPADRWRSVRKASRLPFTQKVVGVLLNLDDSSPNAGTVSVFLDGVRMGPPQKLPEHLAGRTLYPTVTFRNCTLAVNLGRDGLQLKPLPFACRMFGDLADADGEQTACARPAPGKKYSVVVPVGLPQQGFFDYVDRFVERNPGFVELSDRKIMEWCRKSGLKAQKSGQKPASRDRPQFRFGLPAIDNHGVRKMLKTVAQFSKRNFIVAEAKANLVSKEREETLQLFTAPHFEVVAKVAVGEPAPEHKEWVHKRILDAHELRVREAERRKQADIERQAKAEALKAARLAKVGKKMGTKKEEAAEEKAKEDEGAEAPPAKKPKTEEGEEAEGVVIPSLPAPEVGPDVWYVTGQKGAPPDILDGILSTSFGSFTLPAPEEGFASVDFEWRPKAEAEEHLARWAVKKRTEAVVEGISPSEWFKEKLAAWTELKKEMRRKQAEFKTKAKAAGTQDTDEGKLHEELPDVSTMELHGSEEGEASPPIYARFEREDWVLLSTRYELHLLAHAFAQDVGDSMYLGVPLKHVGHYHKIYFKTSFSPQALSCEDVAGVVELVGGTLQIVEGEHMGFVASRCEKEEDVLTFARAVEEDRRDRRRRIEAGDESARLKFPAAVPEQRGIRKGKGKGKGKDEGKTGGKAAAAAGAPGKWPQAARQGSASKGKGKVGSRGESVVRAGLPAKPPVWSKPGAASAAVGRAFEPRRAPLVRSQPAAGKGGFAKGGKNSSSGSAAVAAATPWLKPVVAGRPGANASKGKGQNSGSSKGKGAAVVGWGSGVTPGHRGNFRSVGKVGGKAVKGGKAGRAW